MKSWHRHLNWGYGMFSTAADEHLNKRLKVYEADHTSATQGTARFERILHMFRVGLLHYPSRPFVRVPPRSHAQLAEKKATAGKTSYARITLLLTPLYLQTVAMKPNNN